MCGIFSVTMRLTFFFFTIRTCRHLLILSLSPAKFVKNAQRSTSIKNARRVDMPLKSITHSLNQPLYKSDTCQAMLTMKQDPNCWSSERIRIAIVSTAYETRLRATLLQ